MHAWRLILDGPAEGARNMALDRAILDAREHDEVPATVRLYSWRKPTVSLGRFQSAEDIDGEAMRRYGLDLCRRPTGGRGVIHDDEITYSIVTGVGDGLPRGTAASYRTLCSALVEAYRELGIEAALTARPRGVPAAGACYLHSTAADLSLGVMKLSGSAQVWSKDTCLQHGSFVMSRDSLREAEIFKLGLLGERELAESTDTIEHALGHRPSGHELREAIVRGLSRGLGVELSEGVLSQAERERADVTQDGYRMTSEMADPGAYTSS